MSISYADGGAAAAGSAAADGPTQRPLRGARTHLYHGDAEAAGGQAVAHPFARTSGTRGSGRAPVSARLAHAHAHASTPGRGRLRVLHGAPLRTS